MELFGIMFWISAAFVASAGYTLLLERFIGPLRRLSAFLIYVSTIILAGFGVEILLLVTLGAVRSRGLIGPVFYSAHLFFFFFGVPALANVLVLRFGQRVKWYVPVLICTVFAFLLVLLQYGVSEALYGMDGTDGPYR
jgi:hypothetical protein